MDADQRRELERVIEADDPEELLALLIELALSSGESCDDRVFAQACCLRLARHGNVDVRGNAVLALGHLARRFGELDRSQVEPVIRAALGDPNGHVRDQAAEAADDLREYLGWRLAPPR